MKNRLAVLAAIASSFVLGLVLQSARGSSDGPSPRVTGVGGVFFKAQDPARAAAWYRDHLGISFEPAGTGAAAPQFHTFQWQTKDPPQTVGSTVLSIFPESSHYFGPSPSPFMIDFRVANLERLLAQLKAEGVQVSAKIDDETNGRFGWAMDPEGHRIELWEPRGD